MTVYHEDAPGQANGRFGHRDDWARYCSLCLSDAERHCREDHARGLPGVQEPYLSDTFEPATGVSWEQVHNNLHRLASKHGEPPHWWDP